MNSVFNSLVYLTPLLGGYIADAYWGRYKTIGKTCVIGVKPAR